MGLSRALWAFRHALIYGFSRLLESKHPSPALRMTWFEGTGPRLDTQATKGLHGPLKENLAAAPPKSARQFRKSARLLNAIVTVFEFAPVLRHFAPVLREFAPVFAGRFRAKLAKMHCQFEKCPPN